MATHSSDLDEGRRPELIVGTRIREVFEFILVYKRMNDGVAPSYRDIMAGTGITSTSNVKYWLKILERHGYVEVIWGEPRNIRVVDGYR